MCRKLVTVADFLASAQSLHIFSIIVISILFNPTKIIQNKSMYHNISNIYVSFFKSVLGERFSLKERALFEICLNLVFATFHHFCFLESFTDRIERYYTNEGVANVASKAPVLFHELSCLCCRVDASVLCDPPLFRRFRFESRWKATLPGSSASWGYLCML